MKQNTNDELQGDKSKKLDKSNKKHSFKSGDELKLKVERLSQGGGKGICRTDDGVVVFVPLVVPEDEIKVKLTKVKKRYAEAELLEVIKPSKHRVEPPCAFFNDCGGCQWQMVSYQEQLNQKSKFLTHEFSRLGFKEGIQVEPSDNEYRYRNRIQVHQKKNKLGFLKAKTHSLVSIKDCLIAEEELVAQFPELIKAEKERRLEIAKDESGEIHIYEGGKRPADLNLFSQVNSKQNEKLKTYLIKLIKDLKPEEVFDLYCGEGNITFPVNSLFKEVKITGVELSKVSVKKAKEKADEENTEITFLAKDVLKFLKETNKSPELIILDPPRDGAGEAVIQEIKRLKPKNIVYVSCDLATLTRDLSVLTNEMYDIKSVQGLDMFPQTYHLETVVKLSLKS